MSSATLEQQKSVDKIDELKKIHATIDTPKKSLFSTLSNQ
jgi:hypothetical protein